MDGFPISDCCLGIPSSPYRFDVHGLERQEGIVLVCGPNFLNDEIKSVNDLDGLGAVSVIAEHLLNGLFDRWFGIIGALNLQKCRYATMRQYNRTPFR